MSEVDETNPNAAVAELIAHAKRCRYELSLAKPAGGRAQDSADIAGAIELIDGALARVGGASCAAVAELIAAAADIIRVERSQGITDEEADVAVERLDLALVPFSGRVGVSTHE